MREPLTYQSSFFNWTYTSTEAVPALLRRLVAGALSSGSIHVPADWHHATMIENHKTWLWHEKPSHEIGSEDVREICAKYEHLRQNFLMLTAKPHRLFVVSDGQNNIREHYPVTSGEMTLELTPALIGTLATTLDALFPTGRNQLLVLRKSIELPRDETEWTGETQIWRDALSRAMPLRHAYAQARQILKAVGLAR